MPKFQVDLPDGPVVMTRPDGVETHHVKDGHVTVAADKVERFLRDLPSFAMTQSAADAADTD